MHEPSTRDYPIFANGIGKYDNFTIYFKKAPNKLDFGDSVLITYWDSNDIFKCHISLNRPIPDSGGYFYAKVTEYSSKGTKLHHTRIKFEHGILHTELPHVRAISLLPTQKISIQYSFHKYKESIWEREKIEQKLIQDAKEKEDRFIKIIALRKKEYEAKKEELCKLWVEVNQDVLALISECNAIFMRKHHEIDTICNDYRKRTFSLQKSVYNLEHRRELRKKLSNQRKEEVAEIERKYLNALNELELAIQSKVIKGCSIWAWSWLYKDKIEKFGLKVNYYAPIDDKENNGLLNLEKSSIMP